MELAKERKDAKELRGDIEQLCWYVIRFPDQYLEYSFPLGAPQVGQKSTFYFEQESE